MGLDERIEKTVNEKILELLEKKGEEKKFKYKFGTKVGKGQRKKNFITLIIIKENGNCSMKKYQIKDQTIMHEEIPRLATAGYVMYDQKSNPLMILPEWSVQPFSPLKHYSASLNNGNNVNGYKILMAKMIAGQLETKKKMGNGFKIGIGLFVLAIIAYALISGGGA